MASSSSAAPSGGKFQRQLRDLREKVEKQVRASHPSLRLSWTKPQPVSSPSTLGVLDLFSSSTAAAAPRGRTLGSRLAVSHVPGGPLGPVTDPFRLEDRGQSTAPVLGTDLALFLACLNDMVQPESLVRPHKPLVVSLLTASYFLVSLAAETSQRVHPLASFFFPRLCDGPAEALLACFLQEILLPMVQEASTTVLSWVPETFQQATASLTKEEQKVLSASPATSGETSGMLPLFNTLLALQQITYRLHLSLQLLAARQALWVAQRMGRSLHESQEDRYGRRGRTGHLYLDWMRFYNQQRGETDKKSWEQTLQEWTQLLLVARGGHSRGNVLFQQGSLFQFSRVLERNGGFEEGPQSLLKDLFEKWRSFLAPAVTNLFHALQALQEQCRVRGEHPALVSALVPGSRGWLRQEPERFVAEWADLLVGGESLPSLHRSVALLKEEEDELEENKQVLLHLWLANLLQFFVVTVGAPPEAKMASLVATVDQTVGIPITSQLSRPISLVLWFRVLYELQQTHSELFPREDPLHDLLFQLKQTKRAGQLLRERYLQALFQNTQTLEVQYLPVPLPQEILLSEEEGNSHHCHQLLFLTGLTTPSAACQSK